MSREQKCRVCGCTDERGCRTTLGTCCWVKPDLCSACAGGEFMALELGPDDVTTLQLMPPIACHLDGVSAFMLLAALQLVCRHPQFDGLSRELAEQFARGLQERIGVTPNLAELCEAGWDPLHDAPAPAAERPRLILPGDRDFGL